MRENRSGRPDFWLLSGVLACAFLLMLLAAPSLERPAMQTDETLFAAGIYPPVSDVPLLFGKPFPRMIMTYVGTFKSMLYRPVMRWAGTGPYQVRMTGIVLSALGVALFGWWLVRASGSRAALLALAVLACDPVYVMYSRWDHGPVVTLHLLLILTLICGCRFGVTGRRRWLCAGAFVIGLAMWEKAVFSWLIVGLGAGLVLVYPRQLWRRITLPNIGLAVVCFAAGAAPLIWYNVEHEGVTFRSNTKFDLSQAPAKLSLLSATFQGNALLGSMAREWPDKGEVREPATWAERMMVTIATAFGERRKGWFLLLFLACVPIVAFGVRHGGRPGLFALVAGSAAYLLMVVTKDAGGGAHHTILLWPLPYLLIASAVTVVGTYVQSRAAMAVMAAIFAAVCIMNVAVIGTYYTHLIRFGGTDSWTEAMYPALAHIRTSDHQAVGVVDWGFFDTVRLSEQGRSAVYPVTDPSGSEAKYTVNDLATPGAIFITHTKGHEMFAGVTERILAEGAKAGLVPTDRRVFYDYNGRPTVETFRITRINSTSPERTSNEAAPR
jgi:hypothetical protein